MVGLSSVMNNLFLPSLLFLRLGGNLSAEVLHHSYPLLLASLLITFITFLISNFIFCKWAEPKKNFKPWFNIGQLLPNQFSLPLLFISSVCEDVQFKPPPFHVPSEDDLREVYYYDDDGAANETFLNIDECIEIGELYNFLFAFPLTLALFTIAPLYIKLVSGKPPLETIMAIEQSRNVVRVSKEAERVPHSQISSRAGIIVMRASNPMLRSSVDLLDEDEKVSISNSEPNHADNLAKKSNHCVNVVVAMFENPPAFALLVGLFVGLIPGCQDFVFGENAPFRAITDTFSLFGAGVSPVLNIILACTLALKLNSLENKWDMFGNEERVGISRKTLFYYAGCRMILMPIVTFAVLQGVYSAGGFQEDLLMKFVMNLLISMPTSPLLVMMAQISGDLESAQSLALSGLLQFMLSLFSMTVLLVLSLITLDLS